MKIINSTIAAALIASASFAGAALADEGDYYNGATEVSAKLDHVQTGSVANDAKQVQPSVGRGDYYDGANRPN